jgi:hypothetical protein
LNAEKMNEVISPRNRNFTLCYFLSTTLPIGSCPTQAAELLWATYSLSSWLLISGEYWNISSTCLIGADVTRQCHQAALKVIDKALQNTMCHHCGLCPMPVGVALYKSCPQSEGSNHFSM